MNALWIGLSGLLGFVVPVVGAEQATVTIRLVTPGLPSDRTVFITGNIAALGQWDPGATPMKRIGPDLWEFTLKLRPGFALEYKFTLGSWDTEALRPDGSVPPNSVLRVEGDVTVVDVVYRWKGRDPSVPSKITGRVDRYPAFEGRGLRPRDVLIWLPPDYESNTEARYPVLYMHDGQQVFDPATSTHGVDWGVDERATELIQQGRMRGIIVVAAYNTPDRRAEYGETDLGAAYRRFIVEELKPFVDRTYRTLPDRENTAVMGSSMGGRVSLLLAWEYPEVFSMAGCLSPSFSEETLQLVARGRPEAPLRIYMDNGGRGLDAELQRNVDRMLDLLADQGFRFGEDLVWFRDPAANHDEAAWAQRVWMPLLYFFGVGPQDWIRQLPPR